jgi:flagellar biosynthesis protein FlhF
MGEKTYHGRTMKEALAKVRKDLGGDALILASREVRRGRLFGLGPRELIEVTASPTMPSRPSATASESPVADGPGGESTSMRSRRPWSLGAEPSRLHSRIEVLDRAAPAHHLFPDLPAPLLASYSQLLRADVPELLARRLVRLVAENIEPDQASDPLAIDDALCHTIEQCIPIAPPCRAVAGTRRIVALVGPTGVGKTTTVAKLAASFKLVQHLRVGLVTVDTYRIAAVEQLKAYANIIDISLAVANDPGAMRQAIDELGAVDIVFIDTAGRSPRDDEKIRELECFVTEARPDEVHLVLSAGAAGPTLRSATLQFGQVGADRLILTKLDEAQSLGAVLGVLGQSSLPVSYFTTGQGVPDDIEVADRKKLARLVLGLETIG